MRYAAAAIIASLVFCDAPALSEQVLTPRAFTERFAKGLGAAAPEANVVVRDELRLTFTLPHGGAQDINLSNVYGEYRGQPDRFGDLVALFVLALKQPVSPKLQAARIVPIIKDRAWLDSIAPIFSKRGAEPLYQSLSNDLIIAYVEDSDSRSRYLNTLDDVGDRSDLLQRSVSNLARILPKIMLHQHDGEVFEIAARSNFEPSLLLFDDIWASGQIKVDGEIVVAIPARDSLLVTGSHSRMGLETLRTMVAKLADGPYRLSRKLFVYRNGGFVEFDGD